MTDNKSKRISTFGSRFTSMMSVCMVLLLLGLAGLTAIVTHRLDNDVLRNIGFVVLLERECPSEDINVLKRELLQSPGIESIEFKSAEEILAEESDFMGEDIAALIDANPYSGEIDVKVRPAYASPDSIAGLTDYVSHFAGVYDIVTETALIEGVHTMSRRITAVLLALAVLLLVISVALIGNAVSLSIYSRRFIIHTMKLVGATGSFVRRPFLVAACTNGAIAGVLASVLLLLSAHFLPQFASLPGIPVSIPEQLLMCVALVIAGVLLCSLTAVVATNRYLRANYDEMFLK